MGTVLLVALGGGLGAVARYLTGLGAASLFGTGYPWGTLAVNVVGGLLMGVLVGLGVEAWQPSPALKAFLTTGLLGGFTTFSSFSLEVVLLYERGEPLAAFGYAAVSVVLSVGALFAGLWAARMMAA